MRSPTSAPITPAQISLVPAAPAQPAPPATGTGPGGGQEADLGVERILLCPGPESARGAREFTTQTLRGWHLDEIVQEAVIIASELVTNAIRHGMSAAGEGPGLRDVELSWRRQDSQVICTVTDGSAKPPVLAPSDVTSESGRGLQIVQSIAVAWGWMILSGTSKAVWAALQPVSNSLLASGIGRWQP